MPYSSSLSDAEWEVLEPYLREILPKKKQTRPQNWSHRELLDAMLYQLKNGCHWQDLPSEFPPYSTVYWHYKQWRRDAGVFDQLMEALQGEVRVHAKKKQMDNPDDHRLPSSEEYL
ncbi:transposase [Leptolyngbya sp. NIES-2104]|uniref:transposase n=1 Tax=Leptolyngbya sp. NIES-2104 TaxID=1552121 RepID=UPI00073E2923|nr:transposase [Leptolyngbya sp. NIES-2104]